MLYSANKRIRQRQIIGDMGVVLWCALWIYVGRVVHNLIMDLAKAGHYLVDSGNAVGRLGGSLGNHLSNAGNSQIHAVHHVAFAVGLLIALGPTLPILIKRVVLRLAWMRLTKLMQDHQRGPGAQRLLAERALAHQPLDRLLHISPDPVADVATGNFAPYAALEINR